MFCALMTFNAFYTLPLKVFNAFLRFFNEPSPNLTDFIFWDKRMMLEIIKPYLKFKEFI